MKTCSRVQQLLWLALVAFVPFTNQAASKVTFDNQSGKPALVKLVGPTTTSVSAENTRKESVSVSAGHYFIKVRYGTPGNYTYSKGDEFDVTETAAAASHITITLHKVVAGNYDSRPISEAEFGASAGDDTPAAAPPIAGQAWTNSLGMKFVPVPGIAVLFCIWETRVQDFEAFVNATGHEARRSTILFVNGLKIGVDDWKRPGFTQGPTHPVVGVNWEDANAFCAWLTLTERKRRLLTDQQSYRLPSDAEWSEAVGKGKYPWGDSWPPPSRAGNYAGEESKIGDTPSDFTVISSYNDGFAKTSPVGSFKVNSFGLYDLGGNAAEWCEYLPAGSENGGGTPTVPVLRGASWASADENSLLSSDREGQGHMPSRSGLYKGFRCVLVTGASGRH